MTDEVMAAFPRMHQIIKPGRVGSARVRHFRITTKEANEALWSGKFNYPGMYVQLEVYEKTPEGKRVKVPYMNDSYFERKSCLPLVKKARGRVLITGLGLGMVNHPLYENPAVDKVTILEKNQDVIDLIAPTCQHPKLEIIKADADDWHTNRKFDSIWLDTWFYWHPSKEFQDMQMSHKMKYAGFLAQGGWIQCWAEEEVAARIGGGCVMPVGV